MSATLTELRKLSESSAELLLQNIATDHVASRASRMLALTSALAEVDTVADVVEVILDLGMDVVEANCGLIGRTEHGAFHCIRASGYDDITEARLLAVTLDDSSPLGTSIRLGRPVYLSSVQEYQTRFPVDFQHMGRPSGAQAHVALPLVHRDVLIGGLALGFAKASAFNSDERSFLSFLARIAACSLARALQSDAERMSKRDCERLARTRTELLGVVAHDLRNPLNLIQLTAESMRDAELPIAVREEMLMRCIRATRHMNRLIEDLLDATHIQAAGLRLDVGPVDVNELMAQLYDEYRPLAADREIAWEVCGVDGAVTARLDASRVLQAVGNLVGNALKFTPQRGRVAARARVVGDEVIIAVTDTGVGMPPDAVARVFEPFWQAKSDRRGVGLGLTIAKGIAEAHGGRIEIDTTQGKGSTFRLNLPLAPAVTRAA